MRKLTFVLSLALLAAPVAAQAQYEPGPRSPSIVRPASMGGYDGGGWSGYGHGYNYNYGPGSHACSPHGCSGGICHGYDNCCLRCPTLLCCLKRIGCMLDCLLPCRTCNSGCCQPCGGGLFQGGCRPHLFAGGRCGPSCDAGCPTCTSHAPGPAATDPFQDDPTPPTPMPDTGKDARRHPIWNQPAAPAPPASPALSASASAGKPQLLANPFKLLATQPSPGAKNITPPAPVVMSRRMTRPAVAPVSVAEEETSAEPEVKSVLRRLSHEEEAVTPSSSIPAPPLPSLMPIQFDERPAARWNIPANPLRR